MKLELLPEEAYPEAVDFLTTAFPGSEGSPFLDRRLRRWSYYSPHPYSETTRCYVLRDAQGLVAHGGLSPLQYLWEGQIKTSFQVIDWAGAERCTGAGFLLFNRLWKTADSYLGIGGSDDARRVMRRIPGMRSDIQLSHFAIPLRPWGQFASVSARSWKDPAKLIRAWRWRSGALRPDRGAWSAERVERWAASDQAWLQPDPAGAYVPLRRTPELIQFWLGFPDGKVLSWRLLYQGEPVGFVAVSFLRFQARIVDLVVTNRYAPLAEAFGFVIDLVRQTNRDVYELAAGSSAPPVIAAMAAAGLVARGTSEVFFGDPRKAFPPEIPVEINLTIGDAFYLQTKKVEFDTF